jgi:LacI family transcriptional regulator
LHNRGEVSERTKNKILKIISELDYKPNIFASNLASKKSAIFATLLPQPPSKEGYWNKPFIGIKKRIAELQQYGIQISPFTFSQTDRTEFVKESEKIIDMKPDGVVFAPFFKKESLKFIENLKEHNIPFVFIDSEIKEAGQISYIGQDSYQSGLVSGKLLDLMLPGGNILIIHFAKEMDNQTHLIEREKGFYDWYKNNSKDGHQLITTEISNTDDEDWMEDVKNIIESYNIKGIFVTNSKVFFAGRLIEKYKLENIKLIGHDLVKWNVEFLDKNIVQFLICQRPEEQGYNAINKLFRFVVEKNIISEESYTSIDIITKENIDYYKEFK